jgi:PadR family transcriptional regulator, regulatory protein PadR
MSDKFPRDMVRGSVDLMVLSVLAEGPKYGYLIQKQIAEASGNRLPLAAGTLYPLLHRLETDKLIRARWDDSTGRQRKWYDLTAAGRRRLGEQARHWGQFADCVNRLLLPFIESGPQPA